MTGRPQARAWIVWGAAVLAYTLAVLQRSSLGVMGLTAAAHFHATAGIVATFMMLQLAVYALAQLPAGLLLDRLGPRVVITLGAVLMTTGQLIIALTSDPGLAILARILVGAGDACTFSSAIRVIPAWFPARQVPMLTQLTGLIGQIGQIGSTVGLVTLVGTRGWRTTYLVAAAAGVVGILTSALLLRDAPAGSRDQRASASVRQLPREVLAVIRNPATGVGFWAHWSTNLGGVVYSMMWGMPYLTRAEGRSTATASGLMTFYIIASAVSGPVAARLTQRHPLRRTTLVVGMVGLAVVPWIAVLGWPGRAPLWLLATLSAGLGLCLPGGAIGFDVLRTSHPAQRLGTATGIAIMGGFTASLILIQVIGLVLDRLCPGGDYTLSAFRWAMSIQLIFFAVGIWGLLDSGRRMRAMMAASGTVVPPWREAIARHRGGRDG
ncbi:MFS transporter [Acidipropionibacterium jensenii]|uniref:MFS transporter n=1 Tax=Acidipropionibacterium jensenii TaxID=1749 RepID=UPI000BC34358|nr:MFS transporter [Acidipropionibacterium jensenii]AZZ42844.1 MFS transporter [Acidipropionibacterium jensenii]